MTTSSDAIDQALNLRAGSPLAALRARRPEFVSGAEACRAAVLHPAADLGLSSDLRTALVRRITALAENPALLAVFPEPSDPALAALARGETPEDPALAALARHADMIAVDPARSGPDDLSALQDAGFDVPQIIALSELFAYACYVIRVVHGLSLLEEASA